MSKKLSVVHLLLLFALFFFFIATRGIVLAGWVVDSQGQLVYEQEGSVLAATPTGLTKKESIRTTELDQKAKKAYLGRRGDNIVVELEDEKGKKVKLPESTPSAELEIEEPEDKRSVKVRPAGNALAIIRGKIAAQTHFPLMVNLETNELIVTTPAGQKVVTVLPDEAVENMLAANVLDQLGGKGGLRWLEYKEATPSATPTPTATEAAAPIATEAAKLIKKQVIKLTVKDGVLAYEIPGIKFKKFLGISKVQLRRTAVVSAETGELLRIKQTLLERILDLLSF